MTFAVRALGVWLTVWLAVGTVFPACCWSIADAHEHLSHQKAPSETAHTHHLHRGDHAADAAPTPSASVVRGNAPHDCGGESADAIATSTASLSRADVLSIVAAVAPIAPPSHIVFAGRSDLAPPGASPGSAFLSPLRV